MRNTKLQDLLNEGIEKFLEDSKHSIQITRSQNGVEIVTLRSGMPLNVILDKNSITEAVIAMNNELLNESHEVIDVYFSRLENLLNSHSKLILRKEDDSLYSKYSKKLEICDILKDTPHTKLYSTSVVGVLEYANAFLEMND